MPPQGDELVPFPPSISHSTQLDLPNTTADPSIPHSTQFDLANIPADPAAQIPPNIPMDIGFDHFDVTEDLLRWSMGDGMAGVNDDAAAGGACCAAGGTTEIQHPNAAAAGCAAGGTTEIHHHDAAAGGGACCAAGGTTEIQHLEEEDAQRRIDPLSFVDLPRLFKEMVPWTAPDEKMPPSPAPCPEDGRPFYRDADMPHFGDYSDFVCLSWFDSIDLLRSMDVDMAGVDDDAAAATPQAAPPVPVLDDTVKGTHRGSVKDDGAVRLFDGAETSRRGRAATAPRRRQPPYGVRRHASLTPRRGRQSPSAVALFLSRKGKHIRREAGLPRARRVFNASSSRWNRLGSDVLTLDELRQMTDNFSDDQLLGEGAFGKVYKGVLKNGDMIAVKRFASTITGLQDVQYDNEAEHLMKLKHPNIVQLVGYCSETEMKLAPYNGIFVRAEQSERLLCLEYMEKGSLRGHLSDETSGLEWNTRYKIIEGICYGLHYLHERLTPIIHMDLKPANILLDDNMVPKIADFGLSRLFGEEQTRTCTRSCKGTPGYMAPEYLEKGVITKSFDIFSLGVIIIEIITGRKDYPTDETETASQQYIDLVLNNWTHRLTKAQGYTFQDIDYQQIKKCIQIALLCVRFDRVKRPTIKQIILMLERSDEAQQNEREGFPLTKQVWGTDDFIYHGEHNCVHRPLPAAAEHNPDVYTLQRLSTDLTLMTGGKDADMQSLNTDLSLKIGGLTVTADPAQGFWSAAMPLYRSTSTLPASGSRLPPSTTTQNAVVWSATSDSKDVEWQGHTELQEDCMGVVSEHVDASLDDVFSAMDSLLRASLVEIQQNKK